jgi:hypothetical protein
MKPLSKILIPQPFILFAIVLFLLAACQAESVSEQAMNDAHQTPTPTELMSNQMTVVATVPYLPRPLYILDVYPAEESHTGLIEFEENTYDLFSSNSVCVDFTVGAVVLEPGDDWDGEKITESISLQVNAEYIADPIIIGLLTLWTRVFEDGQEANYGGPYVACWPIEAETGRKEATFQIWKTSGELLEYSWYFYLVP